MNVFNMVYNQANFCCIIKDGNISRLCCRVEDFLNGMCCINGSTLQGHLAASRQLLTNSKKLPIYIASIDDYLIPLSSPDRHDCTWVSAKNYLTCYSKYDVTYLKFVDKSEYPVAFSTYTIKQQYKKYAQLDQKRRELRESYESFKRFL